MITCIPSSLLSHWDRKCWRISLFIPVRSAIRWTYGFMCFFSYPIPFSTSILSNVCTLASLSAAICPCILIAFLLKYFFSVPLAVLSMVSSGGKSFILTLSANCVVWHPISLPESNNAVVDTNLGPFALISLVGAIGCPIMSIFDVIPLTPGKSFFNAIPAALHLSKISFSCSVVQVVSLSII